MEPLLYYSAWDNALVVTIDGMGDDHIFHTTSIFEKGEMQRVAASRGAPASAGLFYCDITRLLGFQPLRPEGKVTGLSAHGEEGLAVCGKNPADIAHSSRLLF